MVCGVSNRKISSTYQTNTAAIIMIHVHNLWAAYNLEK